MKSSIAVVLVILTGWLVVSPYATSYQMKSAADARDGEALSKYIEFPTVRDNMKAQMKAEMMANMTESLANGSDADGFGAMGAAFGAMMLDGIVDSMITPEGVTRMMAGAKADGKAELRKDPFSDATMKYSSWNQFDIIVPDDVGTESVFVLKRSGLGWRLTNIVLPM